MKNDNQKENNNNELSAVSKNGAGDKTEDDVGNEMGEAQRCDGKCDLMLEIGELQQIECEHIFCQKCLAEIKKEEHTKEACPTKLKPSSNKSIKKTESDIISDIGNVEASLSRLSARVMESDRSKTKCNKVDSPQQVQINLDVVAQLTKPPAKKKKRGKSENLTREWYSFIHNGQPIAVLLSHDATFQDLIKKLALILNVNLETHEINLKMQPSSSSSSADHQSHEPMLISVDNVNAKLSSLQIPKSKMLIVEIGERMKKEAKDPPTHSGSERKHKN